MWFYPEIYNLFYYFWWYVFQLESDETQFNKYTMQQRYKNTFWKEKEEIQLILLTFQKWGNVLGHANVEINKAFYIMCQCQLKLAYAQIARTS